MKTKHRYHAKLIVMLAAGFFLVLSPHAWSQKISKNMLKNLTFRSVGPTRQSGRFVDFSVPLQQPYTFYAATASGGLWKTTNNGQTFKSVFNRDDVYSIGDVCVAPSEPDIVWVGTGEANNSRSTYWGNGVYKSVDGGKTWNNMGLKESQHIGRIVIHPTNPDIVYVAALGHLYSDNPERGLYKTTDGGETWENILTNRVDGRHIGVVDAVMNPKDPNVLYAATFDKVRKPYSYNLGGPGSRIYKSSDAGATWNELGGGLPKGMLGRIGLAIYSQNPDILYTTVENANKKGMSDKERYQELLADKSSAGMIGGEVYRSDDAGTTWKKVSPDGKSIGGAPAYYYGQIIIDPNNDKVVHIMSAASWGTYDGGKTWKRRPLQFGGDDHALWIDPRNSSHMLLGFDHGMGITFDGGKSWTHPDFLSLAQFYAVGIDNSYPYRVAGGLQDNGSWMGFSTLPGGAPITLEDWTSVGGGDGMYNVFDWKTNRYLYNESQFGPLQRVDLLTSERKSIAYRKDTSMRWNWNAPILVSPHNSDVVYHAGNKLLKSTFRGEAWEIISPDLTTNDPKKLTTGKGGDGNIQYCTITTIDESPLIEGVLWVGTDDGNVWVTQNGGKDWVKCNDNIKGNPGYWVSRVAASAHDPGTAYVSYTGCRRDDFRPFVYKTADFGKTWTSIAGNLANGPVNVIREDPKNENLLFAGTDFAVYVSLDGGQNWTRMKNNMPTVAVHDLKIHTRESDLIAATHGRGIYIMDISPLEQITLEVFNEDIHLFDIKSKIKWSSPLRKAASSSNFAGQSEPNGLVIYYHLKNKLNEKVKIQVFQGNMMINEIQGSSNPGINRVVWNMSKRRKRTDAEKKQIEQMRKRYASFGYRFNQNINFASVPAQEGEYTFVLKAGDVQIAKKASILKDFRLNDR